MIIQLAIMALTTFISVNGNVVEVPVDSPQAIAYETQTDTDLGDGYTPVDYAAVEDTESTLSETVSGSDVLDAPLVSDSPTLDNPQVVALLDESVSLLGENSSSVTGTVNSTVLNLMDRMVNSYPSYYRYAGFRTSEDDSYRSILYIAKRATTNGNIITFSDDCIRVEFKRDTYGNNYSSYIYYEVSDSPNATVDVTRQSIVYTNALDGYPALGTVETENNETTWIVVFVVLVAVVLIRRRKHD